MSSSTRLIIISSILLISIVTLSFIFIYISNNVRRAYANLGKTVTEISLIEKNQINLGRISDLLAERHTDVRRLTALLVNRDRPLQFIERIEKIGHLTNTILALNIDETKSTPESLMFRVVIDGSEISVRNMLRLIEALPYRITIENLSFQRELNQDTSSLKPSSHLNITMKVNAQ